MARRSKSEILQQLPVRRLGELADAFDLRGSRRSKSDVIHTFVSARWLSLGAILNGLTVAELGNLLTEWGGVKAGRKKAELISAILGTQARVTRLRPSKP
jgi:hypothetical protein